MTSLPFMILLEVLVLPSLNCDSLICAFIADGAIRLMTAMMARERRGFMMEIEGDKQSVCG
jgi:hypothetical protein